jgi:hypothetical protein
VHLGPQVGRERGAGVGGLDPAAREHPLFRHEVVAAVAAAHQDPRMLGVPAHQDQGGGVARPHGAPAGLPPGDVVGRRVHVEDGFGHAISYGPCGAA